MTDSEILANVAEKLLKTAYEKTISVTRSGGEPVIRRLLLDELEIDITLEEQEAIEGVLYK